MVERRMRYNRNDTCGCNSQNGGCNSQNNGCNSQNNGCNSQNGGCNSQNNGCNSQNGGMNNGTASLLKRLRKVDFAIVDTKLYLDAYPHCKAALEYYKKLVAEHKELCEKLGSLGMPMSAIDNSTDSWRWIDSPWPWEYEANV